MMPAAAILHKPNFQSNQAYDEGNHKE